MVTGVRGLCNGLGPAMFGLIFSLFHVDLNEKEDKGGGDEDRHTHLSKEQLLAKKAMDLVTHVVPGPPFVFGALLVILALMVAAFIPEGISVMGKLGGGAVNSMDMAAMGHGSSDSDSADPGKRSKGKRRKNSNASGGSVVGGIVNRRQ